MPLLGVLADPAGRVAGWGGLSRGEFESWWWLDWWIPRLAECRLDQASGDLLAQVWALLCIPRDLDIGNYLEGALLTLPPKALLGPVAGHNVHVSLVLLGNTLAAVLLARAALSWAQGPQARNGEAIGGPASTLVLAAAFAWNPITLWDLAESRFAQAFIAPWLLALALALAICHAEASPSPEAPPGRAPGHGRPAGLALALATTACVYWYAGLFVLAWLVPMLVLAAAPGARRSLLLSACGAILLSLPLAAPFLWDPRMAPLPPSFPALPSLLADGLPAPGQLGPPGPGLIVTQSVDALDPWRPPGGPALSWLWGGLALAGVLCTLRDRHLRAVSVVLCLALAAWQVVALGPYLRVAGSAQDVALPYQALYNWLPFFSRLNWPARTLPMVGVALVLLWVPCLVMLARRSRLIGSLALAVTFAVTGLGPVREGLLPLSSSPLVPPPFYRSLVARERAGAVIEASFDWGSSRALFFQPFHRQKVLGSPNGCGALGETEGSDLRSVEAFRHHALLRAIEVLRLGLPDAPPSAEAAREDAQVLQRAGYRWIVVHQTWGGKPLEGAARLSSGLTGLLGREPDVASGGVQAWRLY